MAHTENETIYPPLTQQTYDEKLAWARRIDDQNRLEAENAVENSATTIVDTLLATDSTHRGIYGDRIETIRSTPPVEVEGGKYYFSGKITQLATSTTESPQIIGFDVSVNELLPGQEKPSANDPVRSSYVQKDSMNIDPLRHLEPVNFHNGHKPYRQPIAGAPDERLIAQRRVNKIVEALALPVHVFTVPKA